MSEEEKVNQVLKPTNKKFKFIDGWLVEVEESAMKLKITHKSNHYQLRVFAAEQANAILDNWGNENLFNLSCSTDTHSKISWSLSPAG